MARKKTGENGGATSAENEPQIKDESDLSPDTRGFPAESEETTVKKGKTEKEKTIKKGDDDRKEKQGGSRKRRKGKLQKTKRSGVKKEKTEKEEGIAKGRAVGDEKGGARAPSPTEKTGDETTEAGGNETPGEVAPPPDSRTEPTTPATPALSSHDIEKHGEKEADTATEHTGGGEKTVEREKGVEGAKESAKPEESERKEEQEEKEITGEPVEESPAKGRPEISATDVRGVDQDLLALINENMEKLRDETEKFREEFYSLLASVEEHEHRIEQLSESVKKVREGLWGEIKNLRKEMESLISMGGGGGEKTGRPESVEGWRRGTSLPSGSIVKEIKKLEEKVADLMDEVGFGESLDVSKIPPEILEIVYSTTLNDVFNAMKKSMGPYDAERKLNEIFEDVRLRTSGSELFYYDGRKIRTRDIAKTINKKLVSAKQIHTTYSELLESMLETVPTYKAKNFRAMIKLKSQEYAIDAVTRLTEKVREIEDLVNNIATISSSLSSAFSARTRALETLIAEQEKKVEDLTRDLQEEVTRRLSEFGEEFVKKEYFESLRETIRALEMRVGSMYRDVERVLATEKMEDGGGGGGVELAEKTGELPSAETKTPETECETGETEKTGAPGAGGPEVEDRETKSVGLAKTLGFMKGTIELGDEEEDVVEFLTAPGGGSLAEYETGAEEEKHGGEEKSGGITAETEVRRAEDVPPPESPEIETHWEEDVSKTSVEAERATEPEAEAVEGKNKKEGSPRKRAPRKKKGEETKKRKKDVKEDKEGIKKEEKREQEENEPAEEKGPGVEKRSSAERKTVAKGRSGGGRKKRGGKKKAEKKAKDDLKGKTAGAEAQTAGAEAQGVETKEEEREKDTEAETKPEARGVEKGIPVLPVAVSDEVVDKVLSLLSPDGRSLTSLKKEIKRHGIRYTELLDALRLLVERGEVDIETKGRTTLYKSKNKSEMNQKNKKQR